MSTKPQKFKRKGKAMIGYAIGVRLPSGAEVVMFCPTKDDAEIAATSFCEMEVNRKEIKRAALGPASLLAAQATHSAEGA